MIKSINEPQTSREVMLTPQSINEPLPVPTEGPAPTITTIEPEQIAIGAPSERLYVTGERFFPGSVIFFAGHTEPTTFEQDGRLSTLIDMAYWHGPDIVKVSVHNGDKASNEVDFEFLPEGTEVRARSVAEFQDPGVTDDPDELEDEIEQAGEEGDFQPLHRGKPTTTLSNKRSKAAKTKR